MNNKAAFANEIVIQSGDLMANECERYGMTWGCDSNCPVFSRGECKLEDPSMLLDKQRFDMPLEDILGLYPNLDINTLNK